ncbi:MAG: sulfoxide reductase heme-binding subunit YedZ [Pseudomonadales bacterium]|jgi:sulfoxide reductase heme-binding subunit YedZ|nr:sulfoxide reductase heme-binding subunit YedZ [Pseudomonadales bacterium]
MMPWRSWLKLGVFLLSFYPAGAIFYAVYRAYVGLPVDLGPDPPQTLALETGQWAIRFLVLSLWITPLRYLFNAPYLWRYRRMIGLYALFYTALHFLVFLFFILQLSFADLGREIVERPYITLGFAALVLLIPLGLTSFDAAQRKLGRNWKRLHRLVYVIGILAVLHVVWIVRSSYGDAVLYGSLVTFALLYRVLRSRVGALRKFHLLLLFEGKRKK